MSPDEALRPKLPIGLGARSRHAGWNVRSRGRELHAFALAVLAISALLILSGAGGAFAFHAVGAARRQPTMGSVEQQAVSANHNLALSRRLVEKRHAALAAYAERRAGFATARAGIGDEWASQLRIAETRRPDETLNLLVLECIAAVDQYNLGAQAQPAAQLQSAGLPERFVWATVCAAN